MILPFKPILSAIKASEGLYQWNRLSQVNDGATSPTCKFNIKSPSQTATSILCTKRFVSEAQSVFGETDFGSVERGAMAFAIRGSAIFYSCRAYPAGTERRGTATLDALQASPEVRQLFLDELERTQGRCAASPTHIHPMDFPRLSIVDVSTYERLRTLPEEPSPFGFGKPYPVLLFNLHRAGDCDILGFWVDKGIASEADVRFIDDDNPVVEKAWRASSPVSYYSREAQMVRMVSQAVSTEWTVRLGENPVSGKRILKAERTDGTRAIVPFAADAPFGIDLSEFVNYVDWDRLLLDREHPVSSPNSPPVVHRETQPGSTQTAVATPERDDNDIPRPRIWMSRNFADGLSAHPRGSVLYGTFDPTAMAATVSMIREPGKNDSICTRYPVAEIGWTPLSPTKTPFYVNDAGYFFIREGNKPVEVEVVEESDFFKRTPFDKTVMEFLGNERILVVGGGSVGSFMALELAKAGIRTIGIADPDTLEIHNGMRQVLGAGLVGFKKASALKSVIEEHVPTCSCSAYPEDLFSGKADRLKQVVEEFRPTRILAATDNFSIQNKCQLAAIVYGIPFMAVACGSNGVEGEVFFWEPGQAAGWKEGRARRGCYACAHEGSRTPTRSTEFDYSTDAPGSYGGEPALGTFIARVNMQATILMLGWILLKCPVKTKLADSLRHEYDDLGLQYVRMGGPYLQPEDGCLTASTPWGIEWFRVSRLDSCRFCGKNANPDGILFPSAEQCENPDNPYDEEGMEKV